METKKLFNEIQKIDLQKMTNAAHVQFIQNVCARVESENALQANKQIKNAAKKLVEALKEERRCLSLSRKSLTTDNIREFDHERDSLFIGFKGAVRNFQKISVPEMKQAAIELYQRIKEFGIKPRTHLDHETSLISKLVKDCETDFAVYVARLGLRPYVASLKEANLKVEKLIRSRIEANIGRVKGERRSARQASDEAYLLLIKTVNCLYFLELVSGMEPFVSYMNFMVKRYKEQVLTKRKHKEKPVDEVLEDNSSDDKNIFKNLPEDKISQEDNIVSTDKKPTADVIPTNNNVPPDDKTVFVGRDNYNPLNDKIPKSDLEHTP